MVETLVVQAEMEELGRVTCWTDEVANRLELPPSMLFAIQLCFEEAVSNIVRYSFAEGADKAALNKNVRLALAREADAVTITIEDHGAAFDPRQVAPPAMPTSIGEARIGGLGIHLMRQFAQDMDYQRTDGVNRMTLRFDFANYEGH